MKEHQNQIIMRQCLTAKRKPAASGALYDRGSFKRVTSLTDVKTRSPHITSGVSR